MVDTCCRTCSRNDNFQGISVDAISENAQEPVYLMLIYCTQLQFSNRENFPQQICYDCMALLDAAYAFWKQCRQADATLQQQLVFGAGAETGSITTTTPAYPTSEGQTQIAELQPTQAQDDEGNFHAEESKFNVQSQVISIDEDVESGSEEEVAEEATAPEPNVEAIGGDDEVAQHRQYIIDSEAESEVEEEEEEQEPEPEPVRIPARPAFKIKMNYNKSNRQMTTGRLKCHICKMTFHTTTHLHRHLKAHKTTCQHCSKNLSSANSLIRHQTLHCPVLKNVNYEARCEHCNRGFINQSHIKKHQQQVCPVLHPARNYNSHVCQYCRKGFSTSQNVLRHQRENCPVLKRNPNAPQQTKTFHIQKQCAYCRKRFNTSKEIKRHVRNCHQRRRPNNANVTSPMVSVAAPAGNGHDEDIDSPDYEVHPSELLDCVMKQEPDDVAGS